MRMPPRANSVGGRGGVRLLGSSSTLTVHTLQIKVINNSIWAISCCCGTFQHTLHHQTGVHLSSQSSSTTSSHSWLGMLMHSVVGTIAHTWLRIGIGTLMKMIPMLVKGYVGVVHHLSRHILTRLLWHQGALLPFHFFTIIFQLSFTNLKWGRLESQSNY